MNGRGVVVVSPLTKRLPRELKHNLGKYLGIFLLLAVCIASVSGFLVASSSIQKILRNVNETYNVEDGRFTSNFEIEQQTLKKVEKLGLSVYKNYSYDLPLSFDSKITNSGTSSITVRLYENRNKINLAAYVSGHEPQQKNEIALDRVFCQNNNIALGDVIYVKGKAFTVCGIMTLPDYQALFEKNTDFVFNALTFSVAQVSSDGFERFSSSACSYTYSFIFDTQLNNAQRSDLEEDILDCLKDNNVGVLDFENRDSNQAIGYALNDCEGDALMYEVLLYIIILIMAFVFVVLTSATIESESAVIGTLLASGYSKAELIRHYLTMPAFVGILAVVVGNVCGYAFIIEQMSGLYYNSYSLPPFVASWDTGVFLKTSILPLLLLIGITLLGLLRKLRCTPLQFLTHQTARHARKGGVKLSEKIAFSSRFRLRVFFRNIGHFATLFVGICLASLLLIFGFCLMPTVENYANTLRDSLVAQHQYTLKTPVELDGTDEQRAQYAAALKLADMVDFAKIDQDKVEEKLSNLLSERIQQDSEKQIKKLFNKNKLIEAIKKAPIKNGHYADLTYYGLGKIDLLTLSKSKNQLKNINFNKLKWNRLVEAGIMDSSKIDLKKHGLGTVDLATFNKNDIDVDDLNFKEMDFSNISFKEIGLGSVKLGKMSKNEFFDLLVKASKIDEDAHVINSKKISESSINQAEKYAVVSLDFPRDDEQSSFESVSVYGIQLDSKYWKDVDVSGDRIVIGNGLASKFDMKTNEKYTFINKYEGETYIISPVATYGSEGNMNIYMSIDSFNKMFDEDSDYFSGYVSNKELNLDERYLANDLTPDAMDKIGAQMKNSMGDMMGLIVAIAIIIYLILMYLLTKTVIERNARSISYMKVFGYRNKEINKLYLRSITELVVISLLLAIPLVIQGILLLVKVIFMQYNGNFVVSIPFEYLLLEYAIGLASYLIIAFIHARSIKKVPLALALKIQE